MCTGGRKFWALIKFHVRIYRVASYHFENKERLAVSLLRHGVRQLPSCLLLLLLLLLLTAIELSLGGSSPSTSTDKTNRNKCT